MRFCVVFVILTSTIAFGQGTQADYDRIGKLDRLRDLVLRDTFEPHWSSESELWYRVNGEKGWEYFRVDAKAGTRASISAPKDANPLAKKDAFPKRDRREGTLRVVSPDGKRELLVKEHQLYVKERESGKITQLTRDGKADAAYRGDGYWSPDSTKCVVMKHKPGQEHLVYMVESSPKDQVQPKLQSMQYYKPGDVLPQDFPHLFDVTTGQEIAISPELAPNPWSIDEVRWSVDSKRFTFAYNARGHQTLRIISVDGTTGAAKAIIDETSKTFLDYAGKRFVKYLDDTHEILWMSERSGWNHLYRIDATTGTVKNVITQGDWVVRGVDAVDVAKRELRIRFSGIDAGQDPYHVHYAVVNFDGSGFRRLTDGDGTHTLQFGPNETYYIDTFSRVDLPPVRELRETATGKKIIELERADASRQVAAGRQLPERFVAPGRDGKTPIYGMIIKPTHFDPTKKYPVIEKIYAGPHGSHVPKDFSRLPSTAAYAELGFIIVQIDGMGTSNRSKAFHDVCWKNIGDAGFPDRIAWMKSAATTRPYMDLSRVGIFGGSAGGQNALRALLAHPDFYKVAVADCGCHDNRMDKVWWNELWMGYPVGPHYAEQSNVTQAKNLQGKLFLIVGELDRNVDPASTMQVVNALIKANKDFDLLVVPGGPHGAGGSAYGVRRTQDFFVRHLWNAEPRRTP